MISNVSKMVHDKVSHNGHFKAMRFNCEGPLNALAVNKDFTQVVVAGRSVFKILHIKDDCFTENTNLRVGKHRNINLNYSAADVAWHPSDENMLASAATNGCVVIWNLSKSAKSKQATVYTDHKRSVNRVAFHGSEHNQLLSASQDGVVMIHDVRKPEVCTKFGVTGTDSVRDAQFCPPSLGYFTFAAAYENGGIQTWDMRRPDRCERQFMAHNGPVFSLDWHPADKTSWLATAGRDKMIKVWDMVRVTDRSVLPPCLYSITNIAPVARIKWRPHRKHHISSCSLLVDHNVNVWDVGRPYIPFAAFEGHADVATCIEWRDDCHAFLSSGKDGFIIQHIFADAKRPADHVNLAGVDLNVSGDIGYAFFDRRDQPNTGSTKSKKMSRSRQFTQSNSTLCVFQSFPTDMDTDEEDEGITMQWFVPIAQNYQLEGASLVDMCKHNSRVAEWFRKPQVAQAWSILATFYSPFLISQPGSTHLSRTASLGIPNPQPERQDHSDIGAKPAMKRVREKDKKKTALQVLAQVEATSGSNEESSEVEGESSEVDRSAPEMTPEMNFLFGDGEDNEMVVDFYNSGGMLGPEHYDWKLESLPSEGFQPRHELNAMTGSHPLMMEESELTITSTIDSHFPILDSVDHSFEPTLVVKNVQDAEPLDFSPPVADMIRSLAEQGDVQSAVSMLIVLGDIVRGHLDEAAQESWFLAYIDLLGRYELWTVANVVIKQCKLMGVSSLNQESTVIHTLCSKCSRPCERAAWLCDKCKRITNLCSICHQPVKGLMVWCQGCCHGGHIEHMKEWLAVCNKCPAGCGHLCEYV